MPSEVDEAVAGNGYGYVVGSNPLLPRIDVSPCPEPAPTKELLFKFLVIGDYGVGKTAIVRRYTEGKFSSNYKITIGADFSIKQLQWDTYTKINLQLWDIAGHERFGYMTRVYYKYATAAAIVFDVSRIATFQSVYKWLKDVREKVSLPDGSPIPVVLLANKCDIQGTIVPTDTISRFCNDHGILAWFPTSAKENVNIEEAIGKLAQKAVQIKRQEGLKSDSIILREVTRQNSEYEKRSSCCT
ncbi:ras-related protein Rab-38-like [Ischnura elegans]|uniref:ras-related protein Rab-38-like n=1 Tax=Ischnura elegans TaxID=197161 RepID=UPI001ED879FD|nr:ras-related protein Rab-38-like [Ischnura elegans]